MFSKFLAILLMVMSFISTANADPLATGKTLAETRFKDWTYGSKAASKQIDCVQFVLAVIEEELQTTLKDDVRKAILINYSWSDTEIQLYAAAGTDKRLAGVQYGLADLANNGTKIDPSEAQAGDFIQYWMKMKDGTWFGHSGIISSVSGAMVGIYGAHFTEHKIADSTFKLDLLGTDRHIYIVRLKH
jgi:hypothetical protein